MKKTFFTLISQDKLKVAPTTKVIDADSISTLISAEQALQRIEDEAAQYRKDVAAECETIKEQAYKDGFLDGQQQWANHINELKEEIVKVRAETEALVMPIALKAAKKIVGREIQLDKNTIMDIIANSLRAVTSHKKIIIYVNKADYDLVESKKENLKKLFEALDSLSIQERHDIEPNGCMIETEAGIINAQIENQWRILEKAFAAFTPEQAAQPAEPTEAEGEE